MRHFLAAGTVARLAGGVGKPAPAAPQRQPPGKEDESPLLLHVGASMAETERHLILRTLEHTRQNKTRAAVLLGISLKTLHNKLKKYVPNDEWLLWDLENLGKEPPKQS